MKLTRTVTFNPALFGVIPFVNVLFLVLIFFALSSRFVLQPGVVVTPPFSAWTLGPQRNPQILSITGGPAPVVYFGNQKFGIDEIETALKSGSASSANTNNGAEKEQRTLIIRADRTTPYDLVMRATDAGLQAGFSVVLATSSSAPRK